MSVTGVDEVEQLHPGFIEAHLRKKSGTIDGLLAKNFAAPFDAPYPDKVTEWLQRLVEPIVYLKRGVEQSDAQFATLIEDAKAANEELQNAANASENLWNLPLRSDLPKTDARRPSVLSRSDPTCYDWMARQARQAGGYVRR